MLCIPYKKQFYISDFSIRKTFYDLSALSANYVSYIALFLEEIIQID